MFFRIVKESFIRRRRRKLVAISAVALGATVASAMLAVALGVGDKVNRELRAYGANIEAIPARRKLPVIVGGVQYQAAAGTTYLEQRDLVKLKSIFWANNILSFAPFVYLPISARVESGGLAVETTLVGTWFDHEMRTEENRPFRTGVRYVSPWWKIDGAWPQDGQCLIGTSLAERLKARVGDEIAFEFPTPVSSPPMNRLVVSGIVTTGSEEDDRVITHLEYGQRVAGLVGKIQRVELSALTNPEDDFARSDLAKLSPEEFERWTCTPYATSIAFDVGKALEGAEARPILRISRTEGALLSKIDLMMLLVTIAALAASVLGVSSTMTTTILERRSEIGLLKAIGAGKTGITAVFLMEAALTGLSGGIVGLALGYGMGQLIARTVFNSSFETSAVVAPLVLLVSVLVAFAGSVWPLRTALKLDPSVVLRGH